ncbi:unnamed protein product [Leptosia nina]|uniref:Ribosomal protein L20 n=1 Tax=Leptosia nina TaxID=320188 RepID=A0AAV1J7N8_9NEOP
MSRKPNHCSTISRRDGYEYNSTNMSSRKYHRYKTINDTKLKRLFIQIQVSRGSAREFRTRAWLFARNSARRTASLGRRRLLGACSRIRGRLMGGRRDGRARRTAAPSLPGRPSALRDDA